MDANLIWFIAVVLEGTILFRSVGTELRKRYPFFCLYIASLLLVEFLRFLCQRFFPRFYTPFFWRTELVRVVASYGVIFEVFRRALRHRPGVARAAQRLLLIVLVVTLTYAACDLLHGGFSSLSRAIADAGRYLVYVEGALLFVMLWLFGRYRIPFDRNLLGLTLGYALVTALDIIELAFLSAPGNGPSVGLRRLIPITHVLTLAIWCASLWSAQPEVMAPPEDAIDRDYALLAARTRATLEHVSARLGRTLWP